MWTIIKNNYKIILQTFGLFVFGIVSAFLFEDYYRQFIRFLFKFFTADKIIFIGKNFHLFASLKFVFTFGIFCSTLFFALSKNIFYNKAKAIFYSLIIWLLTIIILTFIECKGLVIECTACNDGIRKMNYNEINYDTNFVFSLLTTLSVVLWLIYRNLKNFDNLVGLWTREDDGSGLLAIFGWSMKFNSNKTGEYKYWEPELKENLDFDFLWKRVDKNSIKIRPKSDDNWTILEYSIIEENGAYNSKQYKLKENNKNGFWYSPEPMNKRK